jgi:hypothetical protein
MLKCDNFQNNFSILWNFNRKLTLNFTLDKNNIPTKNSLQLIYNGFAYIQQDCRAE